MSGALGPAGWLVALGALAALATLQRERARHSELIARACHELRGPLTAARLGLELIARRDGALAQRVATIDTELARAGRALEDLNVAPAGARAPDRHEPVDVGQLARHAAAAWAPVARAFGRELRVDAAGCDVAVRGDVIRLAQACGNLLSNAVEHGAGTIELRARASDRVVRIEVSDDGPGLCAPIATLTGRARGGRGARGRGLAIAAEIAARHGGRLTAAPSAAGARMVIELPRAHPPPAPR